MCSDTIKSSIKKIFFLGFAWKYKNFMYLCIRLINIFFAYDIKINVLKGTQ